MLKWIPVLWMIHLPALPLSFFKFICNSDQENLEENGKEEQTRLLVGADAVGHCRSLKAFCLSVTRKMRVAGGGVSDRQTLPLREMLPYTKTSGFSSAWSCG